MKKTLFSIAFALIATITMPALAQQTATTQQATQQTTCTGTECNLDKSNKPAKDRKDRRGDHRFDRNKDPKERMEMLKGRIFADIELTDAQKQQIDKISNDRNEKIEQIRKESNKKIKAVQVDYDAEIKKILTEEQYQQYTANKEKALNPGPKFSKKGDKIGRKTEKGAIKADKISRKAAKKEARKADNAGK